MVRVLAHEVYLFVHDVFTHFSITRDRQNELLQSCSKFVLDDCKILGVDPDPGEYSILEDTWASRDA